ncbi:hypothetical protein [Brevifollis gellanilyticus]|uniref:hypothetical protein n=1 Tax=Brevifollis gellanilyticus TaxID=748831 RepID=UPI0011BD9BC4|nr:hypothetical protein [Brevifollis gellanilyticus]
MKDKLMEKFGPILGAAAFIAICAGYVMLPASCSLNPEQQKRLQTIAVPVAGILSQAAVQRGWIESGDKILVQKGVAIVK